MKLGILTDFPSPAVQSGPALHSRFLARAMRHRGHEVVMMGPDTSGTAPVEGPTPQLYNSLPYGTHSKVRLPLPGPLPALLKRPPVDFIHGQTSTPLVAWGGFLRNMWGIPTIHTNTVHLPTHSHLLLADKYYYNESVRNWFFERAYDMEVEFGKLYNQTDCLIVQSRHYVNYWRRLGVTIPIEVVNRPVNPAVFSRQPSADPFPAHFKNGKRLVVVCRHDREKALDLLIDIFAEHLAPVDPEITLTLVGDGFDHSNLFERAWHSGYCDRIHLPGEVSHDQLVDWYSHADVFVYASLSETFGNVVNESLWCGLPVVALDDDMGVAGQVNHEVNGFLVKPHREETAADFAAYVRALTDNRDLRLKLGASAATLSHQLSHPDRVFDRFEGIYRRAQQHLAETLPVPLAQQSRRAQFAAFREATFKWGLWSSATIAMGAAASWGGNSRGKANQHDEVKARFSGLTPPTPEEAEFSDFEALPAIAIGDTVPEQMQLSRGGSKLAAAGNGNGNGHNGHGKNGHHGTNGKNGHHGTNGKNGHHGTNGKNGHNGQRPGGELNASPAPEQASAPASTGGHDLQTLATDAVYYLFRGLVDLVIGKYDRKPVDDPEQARATAPSQLTTTPSGFDAPRVDRRAD